MALLKWYKANTVPTKFAVGSQPYGIAFDGENIWTANFGDGTVTKLRASDGEILGTFQVGSAPVGILFDGANIWATNSGSNTVSKLRASDGKALGTFAVGRQPWWPAFDGENVWVPNYEDGTVTKLHAADGKNLGTFPTGASGSVTAAAFDGVNVWVTNYGSTGNSTVGKLRASDGKLLGTFMVGPEPLGIAFDGTYMWVGGWPIFEIFHSPHHHLKGCPTHRGFDAWAASAMVSEDFFSGSLNPSAGKKRPGCAERTIGVEVRGAHAWKIAKHGAAGSVERARKIKVGPDPGNVFSQPIPL